MGKTVNPTNEKQDIVRGTVYRYSSDWIRQLEPERHWRHYWFQQKLMEGYVAPGDKVLEIGAGTGFTANYLRSKGIEVTTIDIDQDKKPNIVANIVSYEFVAVFDHILAFEVFEHIPLPEVENLLPKLTRACNKYLFVSVPRCELRWLRIEMWLPILGQKVVHLATRRRKIATEFHFWEIDWKDLKRSKFNTMFAKAGFDLLEQKKFWSFYYSVFQKRPD